MTFNHLAYLILRKKSENPFTDDITCASILLSYHRFVNRFPKSIDRTSNLSVIN